MPIHDIRLTGSLTCDTPLAYSPPDCKDRNNRQLLPRMRVYENGVTVEKPYMGGAALRGLIRRGSADDIIERALAAGCEVDFSNYLLWRVGGARSTGQEDVDPVTRARLIATNPMLALYGAGTSQAGFIGGKTIRIGRAQPEPIPKPGHLKQGFLSDLSVLAGKQDGPVFHIILIRNQIIGNLV